jgi:hypothetical protein
MIKNIFDTRVLWFIGGLLIGAFGMVATAASLPIVGSVAVELPARKAGTGHGHYCLIPDQGVYFYGRDLGDTFRTYEKFADWCHRYSGTVEWAE